LIRPLPGVLFVPIAAAYVALDGQPFSMRRALERLVWLGAPIVVAVGVLALVNRVQVGSALTTAYVESLAPGQGPQAILLTTVASPAMRAMSVMGSLMRLNFWLFGWPLSLALCLFAEPSRPVALMWGLLGADLGYRVLTPKVGVGSTGAIYFVEAIPILCVLAAAGAVRLARRGRGLLTARMAASVLVAGAVVNVALFLPSRLNDLARVGWAQNVVGRMIAERGLGRALVFHEGVVPWWTRLSWSYYPRCNSPALDDDVLFVLLQRARGLSENLEFWKRRYPSRSAWYFGYLEGRPTLIPLAELLTMEGASRPAPRLPPEAGISR
jgi:hypothetical protein